VKLHLESRRRLCRRRAISLSHVFAAAAAAAAAALLFFTPVTSRHAIIFMHRHAVECNVRYIAAKVLMQ